MQTLGSPLTYTRAIADADVQCACDIMVEAADWLAASGRRLWSRELLTPEKVRPRAGEAIVYLARIDGQPVGTFLLQFEDPDLWPDAAPGQALYIHKLAVRRSVAGTGVSRAMLEYAVAETRAVGRSLLRLDCAMRPKLWAFYESAGFQHHSDRDMGSYVIRRYERGVGTEESV
jgi:GNAT superfamily N-acetyltransferase